MVHSEQRYAQKNDSDILNQLNIELELTISIAEFFKALQI